MGVEADMLRTVHVFSDMKIYVEVRLYEAISKQTT